MLPTCNYLSDFSFYTDDSSCSETVPCVLINGTQIPKGRPTPLMQGNPSKLQFLPHKKVFYFYEKLPRTNPVLGTVQDTQSIYKLAGNVYWPQYNPVRRTEEPSTNFESDTCDETECESTQSTWFDDGTDSKSIGSCDSFMYDDDHDEDTYDEGVGGNYCE